MHAHRNRHPVSTLGRCPGKCHIFSIQRHVTDFAAEVSTHIQLTLYVVFGVERKKKKYFYCAAHESRRSLSETELAVYVLTDSLKMNAEGGEEELHTS